MRMKEKNKNIVFCFAVAVLFVIYLAFVLGGQWWAECVYTLAVGAHKDLPPEVYRGLVEEQFLGPLKMVLSGGILLLISLRFLVNSGRTAFVFAVFVYFLVTKCVVLFWPPYGD